MITIKTNWLIGSITAIVLLLGVFIAVNAMDTRSKSTLVDDDPKWFEFTDELGDGDIDNPANYAITPNNGENPPTCPEGETQLCAVEAQALTGFPEQPDLETVSDSKMRAEA